MGRFVYIPRIIGLGMAAAATLLFANNLESIQMMTFVVFVAV